MSGNCALLAVDRKRITEIAVATAPRADLQDGEARLVLQSFALTANNVTYAASGDAIGYWQFFPCDEPGRGIVPVWGAATVAESRHPEVETGARYYGFFPMAGELVVTAKTDSRGMITDAAPHRAQLPVIYNRYHPLAHPAGPDDDARAIFQPLLATSWLIADWLADNDWFGAEQIIIGSASSKTGLGLGLFLQEYAHRPFRIVGLTSAANAAFVSRTGACDDVLSYDAVEELAQRPAVYVDMAGDSAVKRRLHRHLGDSLRHSSAVGLSHWDRFEPKAGLPGVKPQFFFAPSQAEKRRADWGAAELDRRISDGWRRVADKAAGWMRIVRHQGLEAAIPVYRALATGAADPREGHVIHLPARGQGR